MSKVIIYVVNIYNGHIKYCIRGSSLMFCLTTSELIGNSYVADLGSKKKFDWSRHHSSNILRFD